MPLEELFTAKASTTRQAWPFYVVCDVSRSMWDPERWKNPATSPHGVMTDSLDLMLEQLEEHEETAAKTHICIVTFAESATTHYPLTHLAKAGSLEPLPRGSWTNYVAVWNHMNEVVRRDVAKLQRQGYELWQPAIFFLTDGRPGSTSAPNTPVKEWKQGHDKLCDRNFERRPIIIALGLGDVDEATLVHLRSVSPPGAACVGEPGEPASTLLRAALKNITKSIRTSTELGTFRFEVPAGWRRVDKGR